MPPSAFGNEDASARSDGSAGSDASVVIGDGGAQGRSLRPLDTPMGMPSPEIPAGGGCVKHSECASPLLCLYTGNKGDCACQSLSGGATGKCGHALMGQDARSPIQQICCTQGEKPGITFTQGTGDLPQWTCAMVAGSDSQPVCRTDCSCDTQSNKTGKTSPDPKGGTRCQDANPAANDGGTDSGDADATTTSSSECTSDTQCVFDGCPSKKPGTHNLKCIGVAQAGNKYGCGCRTDDDCQCVGYPHCGTDHQCWSKGCTSDADCRSTSGSFDGEGGKCRPESNSCGCDSDTDCSTCDAPGVNCKQNAGDCPVACGHSCYHTCL